MKKLDISIKYSQEIKNLEILEGVIEYVFYLNNSNNKYEEKKDL